MVDSLVFFADEEDGDARGAAYLMERVGAPASASSRRACRDVFGALAALHRAGVVHGDARLPNLLAVDGDLRWIDLAAGVVSEAPGAVAPVEQQRYDATTLARSVLGVNATAELPLAVSNAATRCDAANAASFSALADAVWAAAEALRPDLARA